MFVKKVFQLVEPFLANLQSTSSNKFSYMYSMTPKFLMFFFGIWVFKIRRILRWFQICVNNWKKVHTEKVICKILLQVSSIEEEKLRFFTLFFGYNIFVSKFFTFSQQFWNQHKILCCFDTHIQILQRKSFYVILALFWNFKARFARNGSKLWKTYFIKVPYNYFLHL